MTPLQEAPHLLVLFRQASPQGRAALVQRMRDEALRRLARHWPAGGDPANNDHCVTAALWIEGQRRMPDAAKAAAHLLRACIRAQEAPHQMEPAMLVAVYALLDAPSVARGVKHSREQSDRARQGRKLTEAAERRMIEQYEHRVRNGQKYGAIKALARAFDVDPSTVRRTVKAKRNRA